MDKELFYKEINSSEYKEEWQKHEYMTDSLISCLMYIFLNFGRDRENQPRNFFIRLIDDIIQSLVAIKMLASEGIRNTCRRELRFLIESSIKACLISQKYPKFSFEEQISEYEKELKSTNISIISDINLYLFASSELRNNFISETKRIYGELCNYVHLTPHQIIERLVLAQQGRYMGFEGINELKQLNDEISRVYSIVIVFLFHSIPAWVVGDFLVNRDGSSNNWYFNKSKYIAEIDSRFDYKHERQERLEEIRKKRYANIEF